MNKFEEAYKLMTEALVGEAQKIIDSMVANDEERQIIILNSMCGFTFLEIGRMLNLKLSTVLSKYNRTIKKVRNKYKEAINEK